MATYYPKERVRRVFCPYCKAKPNELCVGTRGPRTRNHLERVNHYEYLLKRRG